MEIRELTSEEIPEEAGIVPGSVVMGVIEEGKIVAVLGAFTTVLLDPLWVTPEYRTQSIGFLRSLWEEMKERLKQADVKMVMVYTDYTRPAMSEILVKLGGHEVLGKRQFLLPLGE